MSDDDRRLVLELVVVDARTFEVHHAGQHVFTLIMPAGAPEFGTLRLAPHDRSAGARLVSALAEALEAAEPKAQPQVALTPVDVAFTSLGGQGSARATKWFLRVDGQEGEIYFNFDLARRTAEFLEKDADFAGPVLRALARMLRDGEPSLEADPRFTRGPRFENERRLKLQGRPMLCELFEHEAVFSRGGELLSFSLNTGAWAELARFDGQLTARWAAESSCWRLVVQTPTGEQSLLLEDGRLTQLEAPPGCRGSFSISPDRRWLAFDRWRDATTRHGRFSEIVLVNRQSGATFSGRDGERSFHVVEWTERGALLSVFEGREPRPSRFVVVDFNSGQLAPAQPTAAAHPVTIEADQVVLPGGTRLALTPAELEVVKPEHFSVASAEYLAWKRFDALVLVEVATGRLSAPLGRDDRRSVRLAPGLRHALLRDDQGWLVADVVR